MSEQKVKVRIAVAVTSDGDWSAAGWRTDYLNDDQVMIETSKELLCEECEEQVYWLVAELPIPEKKELIEVKADQVERSL